MESKRKSVGANRRPSKSIFDENDDSDDDDEVFKIRKRTNSRISSGSSQSASTVSRDYVPRGIDNLSESSSSEASDSEEPPTKKQPDINISTNSGLADSESDSNLGNEKVSEYFDFSEIMNTQQKIKDMGSIKAEEVKLTEMNPDVIKSTQSFCISETSKKGRAKTKRTLTGKNAKRKEELKPELNKEQLDVSELLAMGESKVALDSKSDDESSNLPSSSQNIKKEIEVKIDLPTFLSKKQKKKFDVDAAMKRRLNAIKRENQVFLHKVHLLCLIAHWNHVNNILNNETLLGSALSIIPSEKFYPPKLATLEYLEKLVNWFTKKVEVLDNPPKNEKYIKESLLIQFSQCKANSLKDKVLMFICIARVLGMKCRIVVNLQPMPLKPNREDLLPINNKKNEKSENDSDSNDSSEDDFTEVVEVSNKTPKGKHKNSEYFEEKSNKKSTSKSNTSGKCGTDKKNTPNSSRKNKEEKMKKTTKTSSKASTSRKTSKSKQTTPKKNRAENDRRVLSSDSDDLIIKKKKTKDGKDVWSEVFLESEENWISVDLSRGKIHCVDQIQTLCTQPITYVVGWNGDLTFKDLTKRYASQWMTKTRKLRVENSWWDEVVKPWRPKQTAREKEENYQLDKILEDTPMPASISEYKNHPLYVLKRHLLKFEAIYPPDAPPLSYVKGEPVYSRLCVAELHSRETWMRQAKSVRVNEKAYKIVKSRPKYDKLTGQIVSDLPLEIFGHWQVEDYQPPVAVNGIVPRNDYGNVELYKPCMLPIGTVHLQIPGLLRVARKLKIDCAPALVGWEYNQGCSFPVLDGFIVCEEFKDVLLDNWNKSIDESAKREKEKIEQRVYGNWKRLIKGLIIRERLEKKYNFGPLKEPKEKKKAAKRKYNKK